MSHRSRQRKPRDPAGQANAFDRRVEEILDQTFQSRPPEIAYHYTTKEGLLGILKSRSVWATFYQDLEDAHELQHVDEQVPKLARDLVAEYRNSPAEIVLEEFIANYSNTWRVSVIEDFNMHIACFCRASERPYLWEKFGRQGHGYCLGIKTVSDEKNEAPAVAAFSLQVVYSREKQVYRMRQGFTRMLNRFRTARGQVLEAMRKTTLIGMARVATFSNISSKAPEYEDEHEWRLVVWPQPGHQLQTLDSPRRVVWPLRPAGRPLLISEIFVGSANPPEAEREIREAVSALGYGSEGNPPLPPITISAVNPPTT